MKSQKTRPAFLIITACISLMISQAGLAESVNQEPDQQALRNNELRSRMQNTLENMQGVANGANMLPVMDEQFRYALERVRSASDEELQAIPQTLFNKLSILEVSSGQLRLAYDPALRTNDPVDSKNPLNSSLQQAEQGAAIQTVAASFDKEVLPYPAYPDQEWQFTVEPSEDEPDADQEGAEGGEQRGVCRTPGTNYKVRAGILNTAIITMAIKDVAEQVCNETVLFNVSLACIVTDVIAFVAHGINENQALCNEHIGAAEVSATWSGLNTVHGNVQHVHDDLASVDAELELHDTTIRKDITEHDSDIKSQVASHDSDIASQLTSHDVDIKSQVTAHDVEIKSQVTTHDNDIKSRLADHDNDMKTQLATHDTDIKARLASIQATVSENQRLIVISMSRQLEILRLQVTPEGRREINPLVLSCSGDDCPLESEILSCSNGGSWPCK